MVRIMAQWTPDLPPRRPARNHGIRRKLSINQGIPTLVRYLQKVKKSNLGGRVQEWAADPVESTMRSMESTRPMLRYVWAKQKAGRCNAFCFKKS